MFDMSTDCRCRKSGDDDREADRGFGGGDGDHEEDEDLPATPYACANATKVRFTALSISSTHMNTMIALRRISTPTTPMRKGRRRRTATQRAWSLSRLLAEDDGADHRGQEQDARDLEREQSSR